MTAQKFLSQVRETPFKQLVLYNLYKENFLQQKDKK